jgi:undecaprenyl diphosphate synthase
MIDKNNIPRHIAIIMDGNGRWAKERGLSRSAGHRKGVSVVKEIIRSAGELGVEILTFYAFSTENWKRPRKEVDMLMRFLGYFLRSERKSLMKNEIKLSCIGDLGKLPGPLLSQIKQVIEETQDNKKLNVNIALNYGSRQEIIMAIKNAFNAISNRQIKIEDLNTETFSKFLYTGNMKDPDLLIRTSGEMRLSNFLLWQLSYSELYFTEKYWPDFSKEDLCRAISIYQKRERRFGGIKNVKA